MVLQAAFTAGGGAVGVMQQRGGTHDLQVSAFVFCQAFRHAVNALDVREIVHRIGVDVPLFGLFKREHIQPLTTKVTKNTKG